MAVDGLEKETDPLVVNTKTVNLQLICKVNDPKILLSGETEAVENTVTVINNGIESKDTGVVNVSPECSLTKKYNGHINESGKTSEKKLSFTITVNSYKEDLSESDVLPPLIDEFSDKLSIIESSLVVKVADNSPIIGYTYKIEGNQLIISNLPDKQEIIITYEARTKIADKSQDITVSNEAYWAGYKRPATPQVNSLVIDYSMGGDASLSGNPTASILKVDGENGAKHLKDAKFGLYEASGDVLKADGLTDDDGKLIFADLNYDTVYYISEITAPNNYKLSTEKHYFVILHDKEPTDPEFDKYKNIDKWDSEFLGDNYECTIRNSKETIQVIKNFTDEKTGSFVPDSGKFSFGIFDKKPENNPGTNPLQILEIEYTDGKPQYKLDNIPKSGDPEFTIAEPNLPYYVYELDETGKPVLDGDYLSTNGKTYQVGYTSGVTNKNLVTVVKHTITIENKIAYFKMPEAGGIGLKRYYLFAGFFGFTSMLGALWICHHKLHRKY